MPWLTSPIPLPRRVRRASCGVETHKKLPPLPAILEIINRRGESASACRNIWAVSAGIVRGSGRGKIWRRDESGEQVSVL